MFQLFCRQLYHASLASIFEPLKSGMSKPEIVKCADGHFRRAIYGLGPYIADYPEQVWLSGIVQGWCPKYVFILKRFNACTDIVILNVQVQCASTRSRS
jgi:hypothetical protein